MYCVRLPAFQVRFVPVDQLRLSQTVQIDERRNVTKSGSMIPRLAHAVELGCDGSWWLSSATTEVAVARAPKPPRPSSVWAHRPIVQSLRRASALPWLPI